MGNKIILLDFDGTITLTDLALYVVENFAGEEWKYYEDLFIQNKLSLEDTIIAQYSLIHYPKEVILQAVDSIVKLRDYFKEFIDFVLKNDLEVIIVSGGIDFIIKHVLHSIGISNNFKIVSAVTEYKPDGFLKVTNPIKYNPDALDFKSDLVQFFKNKRYIVNYIGDGTSDFNAVLLSDITFSVRNSKLSSFCHDNNLNYLEFDSFYEIKSFYQNKY